MGRKKREPVLVVTDEMHELIVSTLRDGGSFRDVTRLLRKRGLSLGSDTPVRSYVLAHAEDLSEEVGFDVAVAGRRRFTSRTFGSSAEWDGWKEGRSPKNSIPFHSIEDGRCHFIVGTADGQHHCCGRPTLGKHSQYCEECAEDAHIPPPKKNGKGADASRESQETRVETSFTPPPKRGRLTAGLPTP